MSEIEHLVMPALRAAGRPTTYENQERMRKALTEAAHARAEAVGVREPMTGEDVRRIFKPLPEEELSVLREVDPDTWGAPSALAHPAVPEGMEVRYARAKGATLAEMRSSLPDALYEMGDTILVWANEGDLLLKGQIIAAAEKEADNG